MDQLVSIIVPVYNCETYLEECVRSLLKQTYSNMEVILINDGSTDDSLEICRNFKQSDSRIVVIDQKNEGVSSARNIGIKRAKGEFVAFVDADDYVEIDYIENLINLMHEAKIGICGYKREDELGIKKEYITEEEMDVTSLYKNIFVNNMISTGCCNKLFILDVIRKNDLSFDCGLAVGEDMVFLAEYLKCVQNRFVYLAKSSYVYRKREGSAMQKRYVSSGLDNRSATCLDAIEKLNTLYAKPENGIARSFAYRTIRSSLWLLFQMIVCGEFEAQYAVRIKNNVRKNIKLYLFYQEGSFLERIMACMTFASPLLVYKLGRIVWQCFPKYIESYLL